MPDNTIGQYQLIEIIGQGGMATVYKAYHASTDRYVAIKALSRQLSEDPTFLKRFQREARVIARLEHRSILPIYDYGEQDGVPYIVMRLIEAGTLRKRLYYKQLDLESAVRITEQVAEALDYAHAQGVIHRDLKPSNILLDERGNAYLTDFGIAKMLGSTSQATESGVVGTPSYMSPEQCQGKTVTPASDIYALGTIVYEMVTGSPPYEADKPLSVMYMHVKDPVPSARGLNPDLPRNIDRVIARAMSKRAEARYPNAVALATDFRRVMGGKALAGKGTDRVARPPLERPRPQPQPQPVEVEAEVVPLPAEEEAEPIVEIWPFEDVREPYRAPGPRRQGFSRGITTTLAVLVGVGVLLGIAGVGLVLLSTGGRGAGSALAPTLPPSSTPGGPGANSTLPPSPSATPGFPTQTGGIIEPTVGTATGEVVPTSGDVMPTSVPTTYVPPTHAPTATLTRVPPTATTSPTTNTPTASTTPTSSPTATATASRTPDLVGGTGWIVFTEGFGNASEIVVIDARGQSRRVLTSNNYVDGEADWSPGGGKIAFVSNRGGVDQIYIMNTDGSDVRQLTTSEGPNRHPAWSLNTQLIAFESGNGDALEIYVIKTDGSGLSRLTNNSFADRGPQFSPDGARIAYMTHERGKWEIALMAYPSGERIAIFDCPAADCRFPTWSSDGRIAYNTLDSTGIEDEIWLLDPATGQSTRVISGGQNGRPVWAGDMSYLFFNRTVAGNTDIYRYDLASGAIEQLTSGAAAEYAPDWGPG